MNIININKFAESVVSKSDGAIVLNHFLDRIEYELEGYNEKDVTTMINEVNIDGKNYNTLLFDGSELYLADNNERINVKSALEDIDVSDEDNTRNILCGIENICISVGIYDDFRNILNESINDF